MTNTEYERTRYHTRAFRYECYRRDDGLWDIDAELSDVKDYPYALHRGMLPPFEPVHRMQIRLTVDDGLTIRGIKATSLNTPFDECHDASEPMQSMVGVTIGAGWRMEIERRIGGVKGCTHLRDLLFNAANAAFQSVSAHALHERLLSRESAFEKIEPPHFLGKCMAWAVDGRVVRDHEPYFFVSKSSVDEIQDK